MNPTEFGMNKNMLAHNAIINFVLVPLLPPPPGVFCSIESKMLELFTELRRIRLQFRKSIFPRRLLRRRGAPGRRNVFAGGRALDAGRIKVILITLLDFSAVIALITVAG